MLIYEIAKYSELTPYCHSIDLGSSKILLLPISNTHLFALPTLPLLILTL